MKMPKPARFSIVVALLTLLAGANVSRADYSNAVSSLSPLGYWRFNDTGTSPAQNKVSNASPAGSIMDGAVVLDVGKGEPGIVGNSLRFRNPGVDAGYQGSKLDIPFNAALNKRGAFSVECWIKPSALGADGTGMAVYSSMMNDFIPSGRRGYLLYMNKDGRFEFRLGNSGGYVGTVNNAALPAYNAGLDKWRHVVSVFDGAETRIIVDGVTVASRILTAAQIASLEFNTQMPLRIGGTPFNGGLTDSPLISAGGVSGNRGIDAWVDEFAYYPYALTVAQCAAHFGTATANPAGYGAQVLADNPTGYWPMDEAAYPEPDASTLPVVVNSGTLGSEADGTLLWGGLTAQPGSGYAGFGAGNSSISLDGANGYVKLGAPAGLDISGNITLMAWVKPTVKNFFRDIIVRGWDDTYAETFLRISRGTDLAGSGYGTTNHYEIGVSDGKNYDTVLVPMPEGDIGNWVFLAGTYDGTEWALYRNGKKIGTKVSAIGALVTTNAWAIGAQSEANLGGPFSSPGGISTYFGGNIDEAAIFGTALTESEISGLYDAAQVSPVITRPIASPNGFANTPWPTLFKGASATLTVVAEGGGTLEYAWTRDGVSLGVTTKDLVLSNVQVGTPTYAVTVKNAYGSTTSSVTLTVIAAPPSFTQNPVGLARFAGSPFSFSVVTGGSTPQTYQWQVNGVDIAGATSTTYAGVASGQGSTSYTCVVSNEAGTVTSAAGVLAVSAAPSGFSASVMANSPIAYWRLGETSGGTAFDYAGANNGAYFNTTLNQEGYSGIDPDRAAGFSGENSYVGQISGSKVNFEGTNVSFTLECWAKGAEGQPDESSLIAKGTGADGTTANEQFALDIAFGHYRFFTRGSGGLIYAAEATVGPDGTWQHVVGVYDQSNPESPELRIYINGELSGSGAGRPFSNGGLRASSSAVSIGSKRLGNAPAFDGTFNGTIDEVAIYATALSESAVMTQYGTAYGANTPPQISFQPKAAVNYVTLGATFSVGSFGTVPISYQWRRNGVAIAGADGSTYSLFGLTAGDAGSYTVTITNPAGTTNSAVAVLTVLPAPVKPPSVSGLVLHLSFEDNLKDTTARGNDGIAINQTGTSSNTVSALFVDGKIGKAVNYQSDFGQPGAPGATTTTNTTYVSLGVRPDLQFGTNVDFSIAFWVKLPTDFIGGDLPFFTTTVGSLGGQGIVFSPAYGYGIGSGADPDPAPLNYGGWGMSLYDEGSANGARIYGDIGSINDGGWHHLAFVFDRDSQVVTYLDGSPAKSFKTGGTITGAAKTIDTGLAATIGQDPTGLYQETGSGDMDDLGVWRRTLTPLEVGSIYVAGMNNLSFIGAGLLLQKNGAASELVWDGGQLQQSETVNGTYTDVVGAQSPRTVIGATATMFYRLKL